VGWSVFGVVAVAGEDFLRGQKESIGRKALALRKSWVEGFSERYDLVNEFNIWCGVTVSGVRRARGSAGEGVPWSE
jgi:hypothetical protein